MQRIEGRVPSAAHRRSELKQRVRGLGYSGNGWCPPGSEHELMLTLGAFCFRAHRVLTTFI